MKKVLILAVLLSFVIAATSAIAAKGTVTKVSGRQVTILDDAGKEMVLSESGPGLEVGDKVTVNQGKIVANPQPEPPRPAKQIGVKANPKINTGHTSAIATPEQPTPPSKP
jgi:hypothetical protein